MSQVSPCFDFFLNGSKSILLLSLRDLLCFQVSHVNDVCDESTTIGSLRDTKAGDWTSKSGNDLSVLLYLLAKDCLEDKQNRPVMPSVLQRLESIHDQQ